MIRTTIFRANPGFRVILKDVKYEPEVGRPLEILQEDVDLAVQGDVDIKKIANSGELRYAVQHGWLIPIEHPDSGLMNEIFGGANNALSLQERAAAASPTLPRKPQAASIPPQPQIHTPAATVEEQIQPDLPTLPAGTKYGPGNILLTLDEKYQLVNNQWVAYNPPPVAPAPPMPPQVPAAPVPPQAPQVPGTSAGTPLPPATAQQPSAGPVLTIPQPGPQAAPPFGFGQPAK